MKKDLRRLRILVTAGPTREYFDPVRFLSNPSSGKMGYAIAEEAAKRGAKVTLISGPTHRFTDSPIHRFTVIPVISAEQMYRAVMREAPKADVIIMAAAVSDWRPATFLPKKQKKKGNRLQVTLLPTRDILMELGRRKRPGQILVGFAAETGALEKNGRLKLKKKNLDWIVANKIGQPGSGFEGGFNRALLISRTGTRLSLPLMRKSSLAKTILNKLSKR